MQYSTFHKSTPADTLLFIFFTGLLFVVSSALSANNAQPLKTVNIPAGEDLALIDQGRWVIASSLKGKRPGGELYGISTQTGHPIKLYPYATSAPPSNYHRSGPHCSEQLAAEELSPHGIAVHSATAGDQLYVVNHGKRESIEIFDIVVGNQPQLIWKDCLILPKGAAANAVAITVDKRVYVTNYGAALDGSTRDNQWQGDILTWQETRGWNTVPGSTMFAPNGLLVSEDGEKLYVNSWAGSEVIKFNRSSDGKSYSRQQIKLPFLPDNLRWNDDGNILSTGLRNTPEQVVDCVFNNNENTCQQIPTGIALIEPDSFKTLCLRNIDFIMGTTAIPVEETLWVGTAHGNQLWVIDNSGPNWDSCQ